MQSLPPLFLFFVYLVTTIKTVGLFWYWVHWKAPCFWTSRAYTEHLPPLYIFLRRDPPANFGPFILGYRCLHPCARRTTKSSVGTSTCFWRRLEDGLFQLINWNKLRENLVWDTSDISHSWDMPMGPARSAAECRRRARCAHTLKTAACLCNATPLWLCWPSLLMNCDNAPFCVALHYWINST